MRHRKKLNHLGRTSSHRKAMLANMASSLILHKRISTTVAKAKALRIYIEPLITRSKTDSTHSRRMVFSHLKDKSAVSELFREVSTKIADRPGGYTRILKTGSRLGDNADMCFIELVDYNENMLAAGKEAKPATKRRRRGRGKKSEQSAETPAAMQDQKQSAETGTGTEDQGSTSGGEKVTPAEEKSRPVKGTSEEGVKKEEPAAEAKKEEKPVEKEPKEEPAAEAKKEEKPVEKEPKDEPPVEKKPEEPAAGKEKKEEPSADDKAEEKPGGKDKE